MFSKAKASGGPSPADVEAATRHATDQPPDMQSRFGATAVKIVDTLGTPHFLRSLSRT
jgi:hypothetical protein